MRALTLLVIGSIFSLTLGCGKSDSGEPQPVTVPDETATDTPTASEPAWIRVKGNWTYGEIAPGACNQGGIVVENDASFTITGCGAPITGIISEADFGLLQTRIESILNQLGRNIMCDLQPVADLTWDNRVTVASTGKTHRVYYSSEHGTCGVGNRSHGEALDALLDALRVKYSATPDASSSVHPAEPPGGYTAETAGN